MSVMPDFFEIRDARWSTIADFSKPAWHRTNSWIEGFVSLWLGKKSLNDSSRVLQVNSSTQIFSLLSEPITQRVIIYIESNIIENGSYLWWTTLQNLGIANEIVISSGNPCDLSHGRNPGLAICLDPPGEDVTILIPHWESPEFLELCLGSLRSLNFKIGIPKIIVVDDGSDISTWEKVLQLCQTFAATPFRVLREDRDTNADVGFLLDFGLSKIESKYVCMLDTDTAVIDPGFLDNVVNFLKNKNVISVGLDTNLAHSYNINRFYRFRTKMQVGGARPPSYKSITNNLYRVMRTDDAKAVASMVGFTRANSMRKFRDQIGRVIRRLSISGKIPSFSRAMLKVSKSKLFNSRYPMAPPTCDNGVAANEWMDDNYMGLKVNIPLVSHGGLTPRDGVVFQNISNLLVHVALSTRALSKTRREVEDPGDEFLMNVAKLTDKAIPLHSRISWLRELSMRYDIK